MKVGISLVEGLILGLVLGNPGIAVEVGVGEGAASGVEALGVLQSVVDCGSQVLIIERLVDGSDPLIHLLFSVDYFIQNRGGLF